MKELAKLFAEYKIYPQGCYSDCTPVKTFQRMYPEDHYSRDLEIFLSYQDYKPIQRGADLSWWGKKFFTKETGFRTMVIGQDTAVEDAGSIVLESQFFSNQFDKIINEIDIGIDKKRRDKIKKQFIEWGIDFNFLYITDASKVYKKGSWENWDFDKEKSKELLETEIEFCNPELIILLGKSPLNLLDKTKNYASVIESGKPLLIKGKKCVVSPFLIGNGPTQPNFKRRLEIATSLIKKTINLSQSI